ETREENEELAIKEIEKEIAQSKEPVVSILKSLEAEIYQNYFENNRWKFYDRTTTMQFKKDDLATWNSTDFVKKISELYLRSLQNKELLQKTRLAPFDAIIIQGNVRHLRPTLYDLLAHRALAYFKNDETDIERPAYAFEIDQASAFEPVADFVKVKFVTKDSLSLRHKALLIYQDLLSFHLKDTKPDALIDTDIDRLEFVYNNSTHPHRDDLYKTALNIIANKYGDHPAAAQAWYLLAKRYDEEANSYSPFGDTTKRYSRIKAKEICEKIITQKDSSEGKINCGNLLRQIKEIDFSFKLEKVNVPQQPFRSFISYRNTEKLYLRLIKIDEKLSEKLGNYLDEKTWDEILKTPAIKNWQQTLPATNDFQTHYTEIKIEALPMGDYLLLAASDDYSKKATIGARQFFVSNISFVNQSEEYFILNRETGKPLASAAVQVWEQRYDAKQSRYVKQKASLYKSNENGYFKLNKLSKDNYYSYALDISYQDDRLFMHEWINDYYYYRQVETKEEAPIEKRRIFFFTDRSIYRPGQTVYFKGIAIIPDKERTNKVLPDFNTYVYFKDANDETIDSIQLKTNEYGSITGKFRVPLGILNGEFSIEAEDEKGIVDFSVEEYKRPKFYVDYEKIKGTFKVNDTIKITGFAKAYAGNNIDGAIVRYRVVRQPRFPYPWLLRKWWQPPSPPMEIAHGELKTDKDGKFTIEFEAIPDKTIDKKMEPVFDYSISADVTDINGETRSGESSVSVGYKSLILSVELPESMPVDSLKKIDISTENMANEFEPSKITVTISKLREEKRLIRKRYWERPDQFVMSKEDYILNFPNDEYDNETDHVSWQISKVEYTKEDSTREDQPFKLDHSFVPGWYQVQTITKDKNGEDIKDIKIVQLVDDKSKQLQSPQYLWTLGSSVIEPGEKTEIRIGSTANDIFLIQDMNRSRDARLTAHDYKFEDLNNEKKSFEFTATEADRGGYGVIFFFVKHNRFYQFKDVINVPWTHKDLKIEYATFRDKTLPGSEEKWKIKISGLKKEKVAAEILASMYDASLDQFSFHKWDEPRIWPHYYSPTGWSGNQNFTGVQSQEKWNKRQIEVIPVVKRYDQLVFEPGRPDLVRQLSGKVSGVTVETSAAPMIVADQVAKGELNEVVVAAARSSRENADGYFNPSLDEVVDQFDTKSTQKPGDQIQIRKNFNETVFFLPDLQTNENGDIEFSFTLPEALTKWKFQALAHTKDLAFGYSSKEMITQKELMVQPNPPRFLREGDKMEFSTKIVNLTNKELTGQAELQLFDAATNESVSGWFNNMYPNQYFTVAAGQSEAVSFPIQVPYMFDKTLVWRIVAKTNPLPSGEPGWADGEEAAMPVLTNRMLVTETLPLNLRNTQTKNFKFEKLLTSGNSETLQHHSLTVEYTSNPAWYAVLALPYLMEYPYECAEQTWNRYYANALASKISNSSPRIKEMFSKWLDSSKDSPNGGDLEGALLSNLQKNQELKAVLLEETPWVLQAKTEAQQKKNIGLLFDMIRMSSEMNSAYEKLKQMQLENGGFAWFKGGPDNRYMTQYIIAGIGHLKKLGVDIKKLEPILTMAIPYLDLQIRKDYDDLKKNKTDLTKYTPDSYEIQYLYMRSFFTDQKIPAASQTAYNYFRNRTQQTWTKQTKYMQGMIALALSRTGDSKTPATILRSLKETSINHEELGMYWKENSGGWFWQQAPIETQALLIEAFSEVG
ncbi:MAG TPA: alpha-2-macroglobulin family protein, partial [Chitinophagaceae bacterium]